uniref:Uncharacterized protein n=1 Tax=Arundo donax TaxID=35708 RepID=A0A0A9CDQ3_ARUDO
MHGGRSTYPACANPHCDRVAEELDGARVGAGA